MKINADSEYFRLGGNKSRHVLASRIRQAYRECHVEVALIDLGGLPFAGYELDELDYVLPNRTVRRQTAALGAVRFYLPTVALKTGIDSGAGDIHEVCLRIGVDCAVVGCHLNAVTAAPVAESYGERAIHCHCIGDSEHAVAVLVAFGDDPRLHERRIKRRGRCSAIRTAAHNRFAEVEENASGRNLGVVRVQDPIAGSGLDDGLNTLRVLVSSGVIASDLH